ncbi:uncharacterized protein LOC142985947 [Anticarsia gemmatalis]|uniref:uncharacterized protein LOC142985947 n=1 Tax=Anticarsia gemmatalis TaxID=129554 RepID=UPI003F76F1DF
MSWDDKLPKNIHQEWQSIKCDIDNINNIEIPRWLGYDDTCRLELHGFCDASQKAYGCVIYIKVIKQNEIDIKLMVGKSRLVPCENEVSLPRLELCGALLLSEVMIKIKQALSPDVDIKVHGWTDSMAVLGWLQGNPDRWKPFVSNRVRKIVEVMPPDWWHYVKSAENPADCASRGLTASQLRLHPIWWQGPAWLSITDNFTQENCPYTTQEEAKLQSKLT